MIHVNFAFFFFHSNSFTSTFGVKANMWSGYSGVRLWTSQMFCTCKWKPVHRFDSKCTTSSSWSATQLNSFFTLKIINFHLRKVYCPHLVWDISDHSYIPQQKCLFTVVFVSFTKFCPYCSKPRSRSGPQKQVHCLHCHRERVCFVCMWVQMCLGVICLHVLEITAIQNK